MSSTQAERIVEHATLLLQLLRDEYADHEAVALGGRPMDRPAKRRRALLRSALRSFLRDEVQP